MVRKYPWVWGVSFLVMANSSLAQPETQEQSSAEKASASGTETTPSQSSQDATTQATPQRATSQQAPQEAPQPPQQDASPTASPPRATSPRSTSPKDARRDENGVTGISPFWEALNRGDAALLALAFEDAETEYRKAITLSPRDPLGHLRMCELSLKQAKWKEAIEFAAAAQRFASGDERAKNQASFLFAHAQELASKLEEAKSAWQAYLGWEPEEDTEADDGATPKILYSESAEARLNAIQLRQQLLKDYAAVKERMDREVAEADEATGGVGRNTSSKTDAPKTGASQVE